MREFDFFVWGRREYRFLLLMLSLGDSIGWSVGLVRETFGLFGDLGNLYNLYSSMYNMHRYIQISFCTRNMNNVYSSSFLLHTAYVPFPQKGYVNHNLENGKWCDGIYVSFRLGCLSDILPSWVVSDPFLNNCSWRSFGTEGHTIYIRSLEIRLLDLLMYMII